MTRRSWPRRHRTLVVLSVTGTALVAWSVLFGVRSGTPPDYRDAAQLARAVKNAEQARTGDTPVSASCAHALGSDYKCSVGFSDLTFGNYDVMVSPDGSSYTMNP